MVYKMNLSATNLIRLNVRGLFVGQQWANIVMHYNDKVIPVPPIFLYHEMRQTKKSQQDHLKKVGTFFISISF